MLAGSKTISICEGAFQSFGKKGVKISESKFFKSTKAYGCLGTAISINSNSSNTADTQLGLMTDGYRAEDALSVDMTLAGWHTVFALQRSLAAQVLEVLYQAGPWCMQELEQQKWLAGWLCGSRRVLLCILLTSLI